MAVADLPDRPSTQSVEVETGSPAACQRREHDCGLNARERGGSLVELLIVLGVIAVLLSTAVPGLSGGASRGDVIAVESDLRNAAVQVEAYRHEYGTADVHLVTTGVAGDAEVRVPRSEGVTVTGPVALPAGGYCLAGGHEAVAPPGGAPGDPVRWWDSDARRVVDEAPPGC